MSKVRYPIVFQPFWFEFVKLLVCTDCFELELAVRYIEVSTPKAPLLHSLRFIEKVHRLLFT